MTDYSDEPQLKRVIGFPLLVLYSLGVTIGAGIYVLIGTTAERAGIYAPVAFLLAAFVMVFNAAVLQNSQPVFRKVQERRLTFKRASGNADSLLQ